MPIYDISKFDNLEVFRGDNKSYATTFQPNLINAARHAASIQDEIFNDLISLVPAILIHYFPVPFVALANPGALPAAATPQETVNWKKADAIWDNLQHEIRLFHTYLTNHLSVNVQNQIAKTAGVEFHDLSSAQIFFQLEAIYGQCDASIIREMYITLQTPYRFGSDIVEFTDNINNVFKFLRGQNIAVPPFFEYETLRSAFITCPQFVECILHFERANILSVNQRFNPLLTALKQHHTHLSISAATSMNQAVNNNQPPPTASKQSAHMEMPKKYCFTHGFTFHDSDNCTKKGPGHPAKGEVNPNGNQRVAPPRAKRN